MQVVLRKGRFDTGRIYGTAQIITWHVESIEYYELDMCCLTVNFEDLTRHVSGTSQIVCDVYITEQELQKELLNYYDEGAYVEYDGVINPRQIAINWGDIFANAEGSRITDTATGAYIDIDKTIFQHLEEEVQHKKLKELTELVANYLSNN